MARAVWIELFTARVLCFVELRIDYLSTRLIPADPKLTDIWFLIQVYSSSSLRVEIE